MSRPAYVFAGGGTGGHLYPGLAVADALRKQQPDAEVTFFTTQRPLDRQLLAQTGFTQHEQPVRPMPTRPWSVPGFWLTWRRSVAEARRFLRARRVRAVLGLGGYAAGPAVVAAHQLGIPRAILNPDAIPGRANRYLARRVDLVVLQWRASQRHFGPSVHCEVLGCPTRAAFGDASATAGRRAFGLDQERPVLVVTGASQGARTVNEVTQRVWPEFVRTHPEWQLLHLTGPADEAVTRAKYETAGASATVLPFTHEMHLALAAADLVVSRAGASTLAELATLSKPAILLPYPYHRDRHQHANAGVLVEAGAAILVDDQRDAAVNHAPVRAALERLADAAARSGMAAAALRLARPRAAHDVARWLARSPEPGQAG